MKHEVGKSRSLSVAGILVVLSLGLPALAQQQVKPTPVPGQLPPELHGAGGLQVKRAPGTPPDLPSVPLDESKLTPEQKKKLEQFRKDALPEGASFEDFVEYWMTPRPYPKNTIVRLDEHHAWPHPAVPWKMEIVREDKDTVWLRSLPPEDPESPIHKEWLMYEMQEAAWTSSRDKLTKPYYVDFQAEIVPPPFVDTLSFEAHSSKLPLRGRWQMNFALVDMNEDGTPDIVSPPPRKGGIGHPVIHLGDGKGNFQYWEEARWDRGVAYDYGGVEVADFNGDGHQDIALAVHFKDQWVLFGDGKGSFGEAVRLPKPDPRRTSRAVAAADLDGDGDQDLVFVAEIGYDPATSKPLEVPTVWTVLNQGDGRHWKVETKGLPKYPIADNLALEDMDADGRPDIVLASNLNAWRPLVYLNRKDGWKFAGFAGVLADAFHFDVAPAQVAGGPTPEVVAAFEQFKMVDKVNEARTGLIWYSWAKGGLDIPGKVIVMDDQKTNPYFRVAAGDLDGDGRPDLVTARKGGDIEVYLQQGGGRFVQERSPELQPVGRPFDLHVVDVDGDGLGDIVGAFAEHKDLPGGLRVWLSRRGG